MDYWKRANELKDTLTAHRRYFHEHAEVGSDTKKAADYIMKELSQLGCNPQRIAGNGVTACIGNGNGPVLLLRADMDALPMKEESGEPFACQTGAAHACGHDFHAAMLLGAARLLKETEENLPGTVKLMFQPAEEIFAGAKAMIEAGILENPKVDAALGFHVAAGNMPLGIHMYNRSGAMMYSNDGFRITVQGKGSHGAFPELSIDPISIASHICLGLQEINAREISAASPCVLTIGKFAAGTAGNIIPDTAVLEGTLRTASKEVRALAVSRIKEIAQGTAKTYRGTAQVEMRSQVPPLICDPKLTDEFLSYMEQLPVPNQQGVPDTTASASEDFALVLEKVPGSYFFLSAGFPDREVAPSHNPKVVFNEGVLPIGASYMAHCASKWLNSRR